MHTTTIRYDRALVRRALNRFFARTLGKPFFAVFSLLCVYFIYALASGAWTQISTYIAIAMGVMSAVLGIVYALRLRASEGFFDKSNEPTVEFEFSDDTVTMTSDLGSSEIKWEVFEDVMKFSDVWLLIYARGGYITLPLEQLSSECQAFIDQKLTARTA